MDASGEARTAQLREIWQRRKWIAVIVLVASAAAVVTAARALPDLYRATATVLVQRQQVSEAFVTSSVTAELETRIEMIRQQIMSRARMIDLIGRLGVHPELTAEGAIDVAVARFRRDIKLDFTGVQQNTTGRSATIAFSISYLGRDPHIVAHVANTLAAYYVDENSKSRERQATRTVEFLQAQLRDVKKELETLEQRRTDFRIRHGVELPEQFGSNLSALERLNTQLRLNGEYQVRAIERRERLEQQIADAKATATAETQPASDSAELRELRLELADLLSRRYTDQYPDVIQLKARIAAIEREDGQNGNGEHQTAPAAADDSLPRLEHGLSAADAELTSLKEQELFLRKLIAGYEARLENAPRRVQELRLISGDYDALQERYEILLKQLQEAQLAENLEQGENVEQFRILDPALPPRAPAAPNRLAVLLLGVIGSMLLAVGAVVTAEKLDTSFHSVDDLRAFVDVPTVGTIHVIHTANDTRRRRQRFVLLAVLLVSGIAAIVAGTHYVASGNETIVRLIPGALR